MRRQAVGVIVSYMMILLHILAALSSMVCTGFLYFLPSKRKLYASCGLLVLTLASGAYLVVSTHSPLLPACMGGLIYLGLVSLGTLGAFSKLTTHID